MQLVLNNILVQNEVDPEMFIDVESQAAIAGLRELTFKILPHRCSFDPSSRYLSICTKTFCKRCDDWLFKGIAFPK